MSAAAGGDPLAAALVQLGQHSEQIGALDARETTHHKTTQEQVADVYVRLTGLRGMLRDQGKSLDELRGLEAAVQQLAERLDEQEDGGEDGESKYKPSPVVPWWLLLAGTVPGESAEDRQQRTKERDEATDRIRSWVRAVYTPLYGHLAQLGDCWESHPLALVTLDWLSELWSVLYLNRKRDGRQVGQQAELGTRIFPAASAILAAETVSCERHGAQADFWNPAARR